MIRFSPTVTRKPALWIKVTRTPSTELSPIGVAVDSLVAVIVIEGVGLFSGRVVGVRVASGNASVGGMGVFVGVSVGSCADGLGVVGRGVISLSDWQAHSRINAIRIRLYFFIQSLLIYLAYGRFGK